MSKFRELVCAYRLPLKAIRGKPRASARQGALQIKPTFKSVGCAASVFIGLRHDFSDHQSRTELQANCKAASTCNTFAYAFSCLASPPLGNRRGLIFLTRRSNLVPLRSTGQNLSSFFVVLLRKIFPQKSYLNSAAYRNVM